MVSSERVAILRRFDFWVFTGFLILGGIYVLVTQQLHRRLKAPSEVVQVVLDPVAPVAPKVDPKDADSAQPKLPFAVERTSWKAEPVGHWVLEMRVRYRNERDQPERLVQPKAGVVTQAGEPVEPFFLAIAPPPEIPARSEQAVDLRFWVKDEQARSELWLQVDGQRIRVEAPPERAAL